jgi:hypothetical protein
VSGPLAQAQAPRNHRDDFSRGWNSSLAYIGQYLLYTNQGVVSDCDLWTHLPRALLAQRPLMFYIDRQFVAGDDPERLAWWNGLWQHSGFRATQRLITAVWGIAYLFESLLRVGFAVFLSPARVVTISPMMAFPRDDRSYRMDTTLYACVPRAADTRAPAQPGRLSDLGLRKSSSEAGTCPEDFAAGFREPWRIEVESVWPDGPSRSATRP